MNVLTLRPLDAETKIEVVALLRNSLSGLVHRLFLFIACVLLLLLWVLDIIPMLHSLIHEVELHLVVVVAIVASSSVVITVHVHIEMRMRSLSLYLLR